MGVLKIIALTATLAFPPAVFGFVPQMVPSLLSVGPLQVSSIRWHANSRALYYHIWTMLCSDRLQRARSLLVNWMVRMFESESSGPAGTTSMSATSSRDVNLPSRTAKSRTRISLRLRFLDRTNYPWRLDSWRWAGLLMRLFVPAS